MLNRYAVIEDKNPREFLLLRGSGCRWRKCRFCDYHLDFSKDEEANFLLNKNELLKITGIYGKVEIVNSGSVFEMGNKTMELIKKICIEKHIKEVHFEAHWMYHNQIPLLKKEFKDIGITLKMKIGVESFDNDFRENVLRKGIDVTSPEKIAEYFDEVCLLQGLEGNTVDGMIADIETGLKYFERVCVNIMVENSMPVKPDKQVISDFIKFVYPIYKDNTRVDILLNNTDFGVG